MFGIATTLTIMIWSLGQNCKNINDLYYYNNFPRNMFGHGLIKEFPMVFVKGLHVLIVFSINLTEGFCSVSLLYLFSVYYRCMTSLFYAMKDWQIFTESWNGTIPWLLSGKTITHRTSLTKPHVLDLQISKWLRNLSERFLQCFTCCFYVWYT